MSENVGSEPMNRITKQPVGLILLIFVAFICLGMPDGLLGVGWPTIRTDFNVPLDAISFLLFASLVGYLTSSFLSGAILRRFRLSSVLVASCFITGIGLLGYTWVPQWWMMACLGLLAGLGAGTIDAGLNAYVARHFSPGLMQWLHASYGVGVTTGPFLMTFFLSHQDGWRPAYLFVGGTQLILALVFWLTRGMWVSKSSTATVEQPHSVPLVKVPLRQTIKVPRVWLSGLLFFLYVGSEAMLGTWTYSLLTEARGVTPELAGYFAGSYWFSFTCGRILAGVITRRVRTGRLVFSSLLVAVLGAVVLLFTQNPWFSLIAVVLIGFSFAPIFPGLVTGTAGRVGMEHADNAIGMQIAIGGVGGFVLTSLVGVLARKFGLEIMPLVLLLQLTLLTALYLWSSRVYKNQKYAA